MEGGKSGPPASKGEGAQKPMAARQWTSSTNPGAKASAMRRLDGPGTARTTRSTAFSLQACQEFHALRHPAQPRTSSSLRAAASTRTVWLERCGKRVSAADDIAAAIQESDIADDNKHRATPSPPFGSHLYRIVGQERPSSPPHATWPARPTLLFACQGLFGRGHGRK